MLLSIVGAEVACGPLTVARRAPARDRRFFGPGCSDRKGAAYRLAHDATAIQVPATVQTILAARIDRLSPEDKRLLQAAAVIGKDVPFALLLAVAELDEEDLRRGLAHLQAAEFLYEASLFPDLEYTFKHALTHEVAYGSVLQDRRRALHGRIMEAMETLYGDRLQEQVERLGHHAVRGERWDKAPAYLRQAGAKVFGRSANREAAASLEQALDELSHLPEGPGTIEHAIDIRIDLRYALVLSGDYETTLHHLREAEALAVALGDRPRLGRIFALLTENLRMMGALEQAVESGLRALALSVELDDFTLQVQARNHLGPTYVFQGDYRAARDLLMSNVRALTGELTRERFGRHSSSIVSRAWLIASLAELVSSPRGSGAPKRNSSWRRRMMFD